MTVLKKINRGLNVMGDAAFDLVKKFVMTVLFIAVLAAMITSGIIAVLAQAIN